MKSSTVDFDALLMECFALQAQSTADWHEQEPGDLLPVEAGAAAPALLRFLVRSQHLRNFRLWHVEDTARRRDVDSAVIADCKQRIDALNQQRNDFMEKVDECLVRMLSPILPALAPGTRPRHNTESLGMAVDRLSILALKVYHMDEQTRRPDVDAAHKASCAGKLATLQEQRKDLIQAVLDLAEEFRAGTKQPKAYYQFKMYNDPALNPELYAAAKAAQ